MQLVVFLVVVGWVMATWLNGRAVSQMSTTQHEMSHNNAQFIDSDAKKKLREFFITYGRDAHEKDVLKTLTWSGFKASDNTQLTPIRQLELARERSKVEADAALSPGDKAKKLQELDRRLGELSQQLAAAK